MAINRYNSPIKTNYRDTYVSQHVDLPYQAIAQKLKRDQGDYDTAKAAYDNLNFKDQLLTEDQGLSSMKANQLMSGLDAALEDADGDYRALNDYIAKAKKDWTSHVGSAGHRLAEENLANVEEQQKRLAKGSNFDHQYEQYKRDKYGLEGGAWGGATYDTFNPLESHNWHDESLEKVGLLKSSGSEWSNTSFDKNGLYKTTKSGGKEYVTKGEYDKVMRASLSNNDEFQTYLDRAIEMHEFYDGKKMTEEEEKKFRDSQVESVIQNTPEALAWSKTKNSTDIDETALAKERAKKKVEEEANAYEISVKWKENNENGVAGTILSNNDTVTTSSYTNTLDKINDDLFYTGEYFGKDQTASNIKINGFFNKHFNAGISKGQHVDPRLGSQLAAFYNGDTSALPAGAAQEEAQAMLDGMSKADRAEFLRQNQKVVEENIRARDSIQAVTEQLSQEGFMTEGQADFIRDSGDFEMALENYNSVASHEKMNPAQRKDARELGAVLEYSRGHIYRDHNGRVVFKPLDRDAVYLDDPSNFQGESGQAKMEALTKYFGVTFDGSDQVTTGGLLSGGVETKSVLNVGLDEKHPDAGGFRLNGYELPESIAHYRPETEGVGGEGSMTYFNSMNDTSWWSDNDYEAMSERTTSLMTAQAEQQKAAHTQHGVHTPQSDQFAFKPKDKDQKNIGTTNLFKVIEANGLLIPVSGGKGKTVQAIVDEEFNKYLETIDDDEERADAVKNKADHEKDIKEKLFGTTSVKINLKGGGVTLHYGGEGTGGYNMNIGGPNSNITNAKLGVDADGEQVNAINYFFKDPAAYDFAYAQALDDEAAKGTYRIAGGDEFLLVNEGGETKMKIRSNLTDVNQDMYGKYVDVAPAEAERVKRTLGTLNRQVQDPRVYEELLSKYNVKDMNQLTELVIMGILYPNK
jgi:hypothetical protein